MSGEITVTVPKWDYFQPKSIRERNPYWFRINKDMTNSAGLTGLSAAQKWGWVCLLGLCCSGNSKTIKFRPKKLANIANVDEKSILEMIEILAENETITILNESATFKNESTTPTIQNNTIQNNTTTGGGFLKEVKKELQELWIKTYKDQSWINSEIAKCEGYCLSKNQNIKNIGQFVNAWLHKAYENNKSKPKQLKPPSGIPEELKKPDPRSGKPLDPKVKSLLNKAFGGNGV